jgi:hypothetical protein
MQKAGKTNMMNFARSPTKVCGSVRVCGSLSLCGNLCALLHTIAVLYFWHNKIRTNPVGEQGVCVCVSVSVCCLLVLTTNCNKPDVAINNQDISGEGSFFICIYL